nr:MAG TPA: hypothetical protein [Caudoviricetes sp.]
MNSTIGKAVKANRYTQSPKRTSMIMFPPFGFAGIFLPLHRFAGCFYYAA